MTKKTITLCSVLLFVSLSLLAQERYFTKTGTISFTAGTPVEDIDAVNKSVTSVIDVATGQIEFAVLLKGFEFKRALMQEHFNENYVESEKFPKSTFKGKIVDASSVNFKKDGSYPVTVKGTLELHGVKKEIETKGTIKVAGSAISSEATFKILLEDYKIAIPGAVKDKISPTVEIKTDCAYQPLEKK
jgi:polyisoprenoid-binding protein YceI